MHVVALEFFKLRRRRVLPMIVLFLGVEILWASFSVSSSFTRNPDSAGWEGIITTFSSMSIRACATSSSLTAPRQNVVSPVRSISVRLTPSWTAWSSTCRNLDSSLSPSSPRRVIVALPSSRE